MDWVIFVFCAWFSFAKHFPGTRARNIESNFLLYENRTMSERPLTTCEYEARNSRKFTKWKTGVLIMQTVVYCIFQLNFLSSSFGNEFSNIFACKRTLLIADIKFKNSVYCCVSPLTVVFGFGSAKLSTIFNKRFDLMGFYQWVLDAPVFFSLMCVMITVIAFSLHSRYFR